MPANKNALLRYKILDRCFRSPGRRYFIDDLIEACEKALFDQYGGRSGISRRQIFQDIAFMESGEGWSISLDRLHEGKRTYYRYTDLNFSINNMPLNEVEVGHLRSAVHILSQFKGMPQFEWMHELLPKLQQGVHSPETPDSVIDFDNNAYLKGIENLGTLYNAIHFKKVVDIEYQAFDHKEAQWYSIHPYYLKQYNSRWFLFGLNQSNRKPDWNMALDRILSIKETSVRYQKNTFIDWTEYFEDIIGVTKPVDGVLEKIVLHFFGITGKYIESKPLHGSQKSKWLGEHVLEVKLELMINYEFERIVLSYADSVCVLSPAHFKRHIKKRLDGAVCRYSQD